MTSIHVLTINIRLEYDCSELKTFIDEITKLNEDSSESVRSTYVLKTTSQLIDIIHLKERKFYKPNLSICLNEVWRTWTYNHLLNLFKFEYIISKMISY